MPEKAKNLPDWVIIARSVLFNSCANIELSDNTSIPIISPAIDGELYIFM